jgi:hypothetical protein
MTRVRIADGGNRLLVPRRREPVTDRFADDPAQRRIETTASRPRCLSGNQQDHPHAITDRVVETTVKPVMRGGKIVTVKVDCPVGGDATRGDRLVPCTVEGV